MTKTKTLTCKYKGDEYRTDVHVIEADSDGPTAMVVGGFHGIEPAGWMATDALRNARIDCGTLIVIPYANSVAIEDCRYTDRNGVNMNRVWHPADEPHHPMARKIWAVADEYSPDIYIANHSSKGVYRGPGNGVGQMVWSTPEGYRGARKAIRTMNKGYMGAYRNAFSWGCKGGMDDKHDTKFTHRIGWRLARPGYTVETSRRGTTLPERVAQQFQINCELLAENGITVRRT